MKLLFLDIDGVLNNSSTKEKLWNGSDGVDQRLWPMLSDWLQRWPVDVILSTSWRHHPGCLDYLSQCGLSWIDVTPRAEIIDQSYGRINRGAEIQAVLNQSFYKDAKYAILDDMGRNNFFPHQQQYLVQTSPKFGLRKKNLDRLDKIFGHNTGIQ